MANAALGDEEMRDWYAVPEATRPVRVRPRWGRPERGAHERKQTGFMIDGYHDDLIEQWARRNKTTRSAALEMIIDKATKGARL